MRANWITENTAGEKYSFIVSQRRMGPIQPLLKLLGAIIVLSGIAYVSMDAGKATWITIIAGLILLLLAFSAIFYCLLAVPMILLGRGKSEFIVDKSEITLVKKNSILGPASIPRKQITQVGVKVPYFPAMLGGDAVADKQELYVLGIGFTGAVHVGAQATGQAAAGAGKFIGQSFGFVMRTLTKEMLGMRFAVTVNAAGKEVVLANLLTLDEAKYLCAKVGAALDS